MSALEELVRHHHQEAFLLAARWQRVTTATLG